MSCFGLAFGGNPKSISFWDPRLKKVDWPFGRRLIFFLSRVGSLILIRCVLSGIPIYYFSPFQALNAVGKSIKKLMRDFLWEGVDERKGPHLVSCEIVGRPISRGGLEPRNLSGYGAFLVSLKIHRARLLAVSMTPIPLIGF